MRKKIFAGNWKMHHGPREAAAFLAEFLPLISPDVHREWILFPPAVSLATLQKHLNQSFVSYGAQNCYFESKGAFTGETSPPMLKELGCRYALVGHSERRQYFGETDESCAKKVKALCESEIIPLLCVGETQKQRDEGQTQKILEKQINEGLKHWNSSFPLVVAYEPVWAIGTGKVATPPMAEEAHVYVRRILALLCGAQRAAQVQILYGGSVKPENSRELAALPNIDGFLVGGASLVPKTFAQIGLVPL